MWDTNRGSSTAGRRAPSILFILVLVAIFGASGANSAENDAPFGDIRLALGSPAGDVQDRIELLNLIHFYSHLADGLHTELFGQFFTEDAVFTIVPFATHAKPSAPIVWKGRSGILDAMRPRHDSFREEHVQRRHFLTNPIVWQQAARDARVAVYLQLMSSRDGGPSISIGTGRYEGRAIKTEDGWRMAEWTIYSDQAL
jgi:hypothetical protein